MVQRDTCLCQVSDNPLVFSFLKPKDLGDAVTALLERDTQSWSPNPSKWEFE